LWLARAAAVSRLLTVRPAAAALLPVAARR
jgi:hypothetical protein